MNQVLEHIPTPGLMTVSPRFAASVGAAVACGLLALLWAYRRRPFILIWAAAWACVAATLFVVSDADPAGVLSPLKLVFAGSGSVLSGVLFLAGALRHSRTVPWPALLAVPGLAVAFYAATSGFLSATALFGLTMLAIAGAQGTAAAHVGRVARAKGMLSGAVLAASFGAVVLCMLAGAIAAFASSIDFVLARVVLFTNAVAFGLVAFGQHLFVFEDMLLELRDTNRSLEAARTELQHAAITDALTGLHNRRLLDEVAAHQLEHHRRFHLPLSLLYIDVDRFKVVNDTRGHDVGDRVLKHVATFISHQVREADYVFRLGGDEFLVLLSCDRTEAARKAQELQSAFPSTLASSGLPAELGLSVGVSEVPTDARDVAVSIQEADTRMYEDKRRRADRSPAEAGRPRDRSC